jgi:hypothetical protein
MAEGRLSVSSDAESIFEENTTRNVESERTKNINAAKYLGITEKGKLRWTGSFENLEILMNELLETQVKWKSPGGNCKLLEMDGFEMRWYSNNCSLTIKGEQSDEIKCQLRMIAKLADKEIELSDNLFSEENNNGEGNGINIDSSARNSPNETSSNEASNHDKVLDSIRNLELRFANKFDELWHEIRQSKTTNETVRDDRDFLVKENGKLKQEIGKISDEANNYKYIISDLNTKIKELEDEKKSLITAIKIVQNDQKMHQESAWNVVKNRKPNQNENTLREQYSGENSHNGPVETTNQYSILSDNDNDDEILMLSQSELPKNRNLPEASKQSHRSNQDKRRNNTTQTKQQQTNDRDKVNNDEKAQDPRRSPRVGQSRIAVLGDSMLKHINARRIQQGMKHKVVIKTFPGAGVEEMNHYVKPTLLTTPNKLILHVGTNDLQRKTPDELLTHVQVLGQKINRENRDIELVLSEIITRKDDERLANKVNEYNKGLAQLCIEQNWSLIKHNNISINHLNNYGLHLNKQGTSVLAKNIKQFLSRN